MERPYYVPGQSDRWDPNRFYIRRLSVSLIES
jgi:hypothetical protein